MPDETPPDRHNGEDGDGRAFEREYAAREPNKGAHNVRMEVREMEIYRDPTVSKTELRVYGTMANHLQFTGDEVTVSRVELAKILGIHPSGVTKALKKLVDRGILLHGTKQRRAYRMNAEYAWKGSMEDRVKTVHKNRRAGGNVLTVVDGGVA